MELCQNMDCWICQINLASLRNKWNVCRAIEKLKDERFWRKSFHQSSSRLWIKSTKENLNFYPHRIKKHKSNKNSILHRRTSDLKYFHIDSLISSLFSVFTVYNSFSWYSNVDNDFTWYACHYLASPVPLHFHFHFLADICVHEMRHVSSRHIFR